MEVQFYGIFLLFWYLYSSRKINNLTFILFPLILLLPSIIYAFIYSKIPHVMTSFVIFFFIGAFIASHKNKNHFEILRTKVPKYVSFLFILLLLFIYPLIRQRLGLTISKTWYDPISLFITCSLFVLIITKPEDFFILRIRPLIFMSEISYGFYLVHRPLMKITKNELGTGPVAMLILLVVCVVLAWLSFKLIEVPARKIIESKFNSPKN